MLMETFGGIFPGITIEVLVQNGEDSLKLSESRGDITQEERADKLLRCETLSASVHTSHTSGVSSRPKNANSTASRRLVCVAHVLHEMFVKLQAHRSGNLA